MRKDDVENSSGQNDNSSGQSSRKLPMLVKTTRVCWKNTWELPTLNLSQSWKELIPQGKKTQNEHFLHCLKVPCSGNNVKSLFLEFLVSKKSLFLVVVWYRVMTSCFSHFYMFCELLGDPHLSFIIRPPLLIK